MPFGPHQQGRLRQTVIRNVLSNWTGVAVEVACGFIVAPFLFHHLGETGYGLWILIGSIAGYFALLDIGIATSVGRFMAFHRAKHDAQGLNACFNAALLILLGVGVVACAAIVTFSPLFLRIFSVPAAYEGSVKLALCLLAVNLGCGFALQVFSGALASLERFDLLNAVDAPATLLRTGGVLVAVANGGSLEALALITLAVTVANGLVKAVVTFALDRDLHINLRLATKQAFTALFTFGWWTFVWNAARLTRTQLSPVVVGAFVGVDRVALFHVARRLQDYSREAVASATGVLTPLAARYDAQVNPDAQRALMINAGRYCAAMALFFLSFFALFGRAFIVLWMGDRFRISGDYLLVLASGEVLSISLAVAMTIMLGAARHRPLALFGLAESIGALLLASILSLRFGIMGVCIGVALSQAVLGGVAALFYTCRVVGIRVTHYLLNAIAPAVAAAAGPLLAFYALPGLPSGESWLRFCAYAGMYGLLYVASCAVFLRGLEDSRARLTRVVGEWV